MAAFMVAVASTVAVDIMVDADLKEAGSTAVVAASTVAVVAAGAVKRSLSMPDFEYGAAAQRAAAPSFFERLASAPAIIAGRAATTAVLTVL